MKLCQYEDGTYFILDESIISIHLSKNFSNMYFTKLDLLLMAVSNAIGNPENTDILPWKEYEVLFECENFQELKDFNPKTYPEFFI